MLFSFENEWLNMELSVMCQPGRQWGLGENGYMCVAESLCCSPETITLLIGYSESEVAQLCLTLCDPLDCSPPGSSVHGIFQAGILEWVAISFSRGSSGPRD